MRKRAARTDDHKARRTKSRRLGKSPPGGSPQKEEVRGTDQREDPRAPSLSSQGGHRRKREEAELE